VRRGGPGEGDKGKKEADNGSFKSETGKKKEEKGGGEAQNPAEIKKKKGRLVACQKGTQETGTAYARGQEKGGEGHPSSGRRRMIDRGR